MYGQDILRGIPKVPFEIPHKISYPYVERFVFYSEVKNFEFLALRACQHFLNGPPGQAKPALQ